MPNKEYKVTLQDMEDLRQDMLTDNYNDEQHELKMRNNIEYLLDHLGLSEVQEEKDSDKVKEKLLGIQKKAKEYGAEVTYETLCKLIGIDDV